MTPNLDETRIKHLINRLSDPQRLEAACALAYHAENLVATLSEEFPSDWEVKAIANTVRAWLRGDTVVGDALERVRRHSHARRPAQVKSRRRRTYNFCLSCQLMCMLEEVVEGTPDLLRRVLLIAEYARKTVAIACPERQDEGIWQVTYLESLLEVPEHILKPDIRAAR